MALVEVTSCITPTAAQLAAVLHLHAEVYGAEQDWDASFVDYVQHTLEEAAAAWSTSTDRLWLARLEDALVGCIAIVHTGADGLAQLRWFLVHPDVRGYGIGTRLLDDAVQFCRYAGYDRIFLLTTHNLEAAARLYRAAGFELAEEEVLDAWGAQLHEQRYELRL